jgi:hypothetical protein
MSLHPKVRALVLIPKESGIDGLAAAINQVLGDLIHPRITKSRGCHCKTLIE